MWSVPFTSDDGPDAEYFRRMAPPENEIPVDVPVNAVLGRSADAAIALLRVQVYSTGVAFDVVIRARPGTLGMAELHELLWDHGFGGPAVLFGLQFADGRRVDNLERVGTMDDVVFTRGGGSGNEYSVDQGWWLHPLPPEGPIRAVVRAEALGIPETHTELDGAAILRAAADVVELWPWVPPVPARDERGLPPEVPPDSWFAG
jgi:hypothetical protein